MIEWMFGDGTVGADVVARGSHAFYNFWTVNALNTGIVDIAVDDSGVPPSAARCGWSLA